MINLSEAARIEKNKLCSDGAYLILLDINISNTDIVLHLVRNTEDITYNNILYQAFPFTLSDVKQTSDGEIPEITLQVSNVNRIVQSYVEQANGGNNSSVIISVICSNNLEDKPLLEERFTCIKTSCNEEYVSFTLGMGYKKTRRPLNRYMKNFCHFKYGGYECGVSSSTMLNYTTCNHTLNDCRTRCNAERFGGCALIGTGGLYI